MMRAMKTTALILALMLLTASVCLAEEETYTLPSGDVDLVELTRIVSKITGFSFLYGPSFSGKVNLFASNKVTAQEAFELYLSVLADQGWVTVEKGRVIKIVRKEEGPNPNLTFLNKGEPLASEDKRITVIIELTDIDSASAAATLQQLTSDQGKIIAAPAGNKLVVVDTAANVQRIREAVALMDISGPATVIEVVSLKRAGAGQVSEILNKLFARASDGDQDKFGKYFKAVPDVRSNSVVIRAPKSEAAIARKISTTLDDPEKAEIMVRQLKNADAEELSKLLQDF